MPGWRKRLAADISDELSRARGAARLLVRDAKQRAEEAKAEAKTIMAHARERQAVLSAAHRRTLDQITDRAKAELDAAVTGLLKVQKELAVGAAVQEWPLWAPSPLANREQARLFRVGTLNMAHQPGETDPLAFVPLLDHSHVRITSDAESSLSGLLLRALGSAESGAVRFSVYDPERLGGSLAGFSPLARGALLDFAGPQDLGALLDKHTDHIRRINATVLAGEFTGLRELALATGRRPEPWRILVLLAAHPEEWQDDHQAQLARIRRAGVACGVHLVIVGADVDDDTDTVQLSREHCSLSGQARIRLDPPPPTELVRQICNEYADHATAGPPPARLSDLVASTPWTQSSASHLKVPIGEGDNGRLVELTLGDNPPHALIGGPSGSGKTNLLYAWIGALTSAYHPDELALYLLDFKEGVSFARFAGGRKEPDWLPHVKLVGVNINDDREFGLAMLRYLRQELRRRADAAKRHDASKLEELREADPTGRWPRIVAIIDEFQVLLDGRDAVSAEAVSLLEDLARRGRSQGIHLVLASQDVAGIEALWGRPSLIAQFTLRIALPKARRLLADTNLAAEQIPRYHAVVNADSGVTSANQIVRLPDSGNRKTWSSLQQQLWDTRPPGNEPPVLFDGDHIPIWSDPEPGKRGHIPTAIIGQAIDVEARADGIRLNRSPGRNIAVIGTRTREACNILASAALSVAKTPGTGITICCPDPDTAAHAYRLTAALHNSDTDVQWCDDITELLSDIKENQIDNTRLVLLYSPEVSINSLGTSGRDKLRELLLNGPGHRIHTLGWWRSVPRLREDLGGFAARFDSIDSWIALDVHGPELAPLSPLPGGPTWYPRKQRALFFDRSIHRDPQVVIPYDTEQALPSVESIVTEKQFNDR